jgi:hypothetical protein
VCVDLFSDAVRPEATPLLELGLTHPLPHFCDGATHLLGKLEFEDQIAAFDLIAPELLFRVAFEQVAMGRAAVDAVAESPERPLRVGQPAVS